MEETLLNGSGWRNSRIQSMGVKLSKLDTMNRTSYVELPINHRSIKIVKAAKDNYCATWCTLALQYLPKAKVSINSVMYKTLTPKK